MKGIIAGIIAGIIGAVAWALVAYFANAEIGYLAWGIGIIVGLAVAWGTEGGPKNGIIAVVIAVAAIIGGKYAAIEIAISSETSLMNQSTEDEESLVCFLATGIAYNIENEGGKVDWPDGVDLNSAVKKEDFPPKVWMVAQLTWASMSDEEKATFKSDVKNSKNQARKEGFKESFSGFDIIFFLLAITTAFKIASRPNPQYAAQTTTNLQENFGMPDEQEI